MIENKKNFVGATQEKALIVAIHRPNMDRLETEEHLNELTELARTAGANIVDRVVQERLSPDSAYFIGKGKLEQIAEIIAENDINLLIFDDELSPAQIKNISRQFEEIKIIDRTGLILDIFADHAKSSEAKTQVELAQLNYLLPRLTRQWQHLSRQVGGIGTKGPGETQLETDRRLVRTRISKLKSRLKEIDKQNNTRRLQRGAFFSVALVGYTNAGKSTLMNALTDADVLVENKLFATLDTTIRRMQLSDSLSILLSDTVGFIRKLPHQLVASFRSTLAESADADLLLHVVDVSHPHYKEHIDVANALLTELETAQQARILIFNKVDCLENQSELQQIKVRYDNCFFVSATRHLGLANLKKAILQAFDSHFCIRDIKMDFAKGAGEHLVRPFASVLNKKNDDKFLYLTIKYHHENEYKISRILEEFGAGNEKH